MTKAQLIKALDKYNDDDLVMILDGFNGGGHPREINLGPSLRMIRADDIENSADCEDLGEVAVVVIGYGCY